MQQFDCTRFPFDCQFISLTYKTDRLSYQQVDLLPMPRTGEFCMVDQNVIEYVSQGEWSLYQCRNWKSFRIMFVLPFAVTTLSMAVFLINFSDSDSVNIDDGDSNDNDDTFDNIVTGDNSNVLSEIVSSKMEFVCSLLFCHILVMTLINSNLPYIGYMSLVHWYMALSFAFMCLIAVYVFLEARIFYFCQIYDNFDTIIDDNNINSWMDYVNFNYIVYKIIKNNWFLYIFEGLYAIFHIFFIIFCCFKRKYEMNKMSNCAFRTNSMSGGGGGALSLKDQNMIEHTDWQNANLINEQQLIEKQNNNEKNNDKNNEKFHNLSEDKRE